MPPLDDFKDELQTPNVLMPVSDDGTTRVYHAVMRNSARKLHAQIPAPTPFWGYEGQYPGPTIDVPRDREVVVRFTNALDPPTDPNNPRTLWPFAIAQDETGGMPYFVPKLPWTVVHLHGSPTRADHDGWTDNAYFPGGSATHHYPKQPSAALLWYHDHANMITRLNVYAGLAGLYIVRDASAEAALPAGDFELPLLLQDRNFEVYADRDQFTGRFAYQSLTSNNTFECDHFLVNGTVKPYKKVQQTCYRLRILNGANSRFFRLAFRTPDGIISTTEWEVIGVDGGFLQTSVKHPQSATSGGMKDMVILAPAERLDVVVDFSRFAAESNVELVNLRLNGTFSAPILQFQVQASAPAQLPAAGSYSFARSPRLAPHFADSDLHAGEAHHPHAAPVKKRVIGLYLRHGMQTINGLAFHDAIEEKPELGSEEIWEFLNFTGDAHPLHVHLVNFEVIDRQPIEIVSTDPDYVNKFHDIFTAWRKDPSPTKPPLPPGMRFVPDVSAIPADKYEREPKDTVRVPTSTLTRIKTKFKFHTGLYMYHCHILEHEDMEMMRPMLVVPAGMPDMTHDHGHDHGHGH